jgi:hypothetical protein
MATGHFEFLPSSMGLKLSPATFESLNKSVLAGMNGCNVFAVWML